MERKFRVLLVEGRACNNKTYRFYLFIEQEKKRGEHEEMSERDKTERMRENGRELLQIASHTNTHKHAVDRIVRVGS